MWKKVIQTKLGRQNGGGLAYWAEGLELTAARARRSRPKKMSLAYGKRMGDEGVGSSSSGR